jgi:hypothetical protein
VESSKLVGYESIVDLHVVQEIKKKLGATREQALD